MAASPKLKSKKEYMVLALESVDQLEARLKDQQDHGWEFVQALSTGQGWLPCSARKLLPRSGDYEERSYRSGTMNKLEVAVGLEPTRSVLQTDHGLAATGF